MKNYKELNPIDYGLSPRTKIVEISPGYIAIVKKRKSRIIMKDGQQILDIANAIRKKVPDTILSLIISGPICSKTKRYLGDNAISVIIHE